MKQHGVVVSNGQVRVCDGDMCRTGGGRRGGQSQGGMQAHFRCEPYRRRSIRIPGERETGGFGVAFEMGLESREILPSREGDY